MPNSSFKYILVSSYFSQEEIDNISAKDPSNDTFEFLEAYLSKKVELSKKEILHLLEQGNKYFSLNAFINYAPYIEKNFKEQGYCRERLFQWAGKGRFGHIILLFLKEHLSQIEEMGITSDNINQLILKGPAKLRCLSAYFPSLLEEKFSLEKLLYILTLNNGENNIEYLASNCPISTSVYSSRFTGKLKKLSEDTLLDSRYRQTLKDILEKKEMVLRELEYRYPINFQEKIKLEKKFLEMRVVFPESSDKTQNIPLATLIGEAPLLNLIPTVINKKKKGKKKIIETIEISNSNNNLSFFKPSDFPEFPEMTEPKVSSHLKPSDEVSVLLEEGSVALVNHSEEPPFKIKKIEAVDHYPQRKTNSCPVMFAYEAPPPPLPKIDKIETQSIGSIFSEHYFSSSTLT